MSAKAIAYQKQITGSELEFVVDGVKFDGVRGGALLEAKGPGNLAVFEKWGPRSGFKARRRS